MEKTSDEKHSIKFSAAHVYYFVNIKNFNDRMIVKNNITTCYSPSAKGSCLSGEMIIFRLRALYSSSLCAIVGRRCSAIGS